MKANAVGICAVLAMCAAAPAWGQVQTEVPLVIAGAPSVTVEHIKIHGASLEGNLEGEAVDRDAIIFLPPSYSKDTARRYPVVYALHGYSIGAEQWTHEIHVPQTIEGAFAQGAKEFIFVMPDSKTAYWGSMYSSSSTVGDFEDYVAHDVVAYVDSHYRTIPDRLSRGLVGHSMGGYGALRIGMKHSDVFGVLYVMSPCCLSQRPAPDPNSAEEKAFDAAVAAMKSPADSSNMSFFQRAELVTAAAWSPDPKNPPLYLDLPVKNGVVQQDVLNKWMANSPLYFIDQYVGHLRQYRAIGMDVGDQDMLRFDTTKVHESLDSYDIPNSFEIYHGTHTSAVAVRMQTFVLPFFSEHLCFSEGCK